MALTDLTTLAAVQLYATGISPPTADIPQVQSLITQVSSALLSDLRRNSLLSRTITNEPYNGRAGQLSLTLRNWPVTSVTLLQASTQSIWPTYGNAPVTIPAVSTANGPPTGSGYFLEPWDGYPPGKNQQIQLMGYVFTPGLSNIFVTYQAGYLVSKEAWTIPGTPFQITPLSPNGLMVQDAGVTTAAGVALTAIAQGGTPSTGQYIPPNPVGALGATLTSYYTFAVADVGTGMLLSYSYIPQVIASAATQLTAEYYKYRARIGEKTRSLGGQETASYDAIDLPPWTKEALDAYRDVGPFAF